MRKETTIEKAQALKYRLIDCEECDYVYKKCEKHTKEAKEILEQAENHHEYEFIKTGLNIK